MPQDSKSDYRPSSSRSQSRSRERRKAASVDTAIPVPTSELADLHMSSSEALNNEPNVRDFQDSYTAGPARLPSASSRRSQSHVMASPESEQPRSPDFSESDDANVAKGSGSNRSDAHVPLGSSSSRQKHGTAASEKRPGTSRKYSASGPDTSRPASRDVTPTHGYGPGDRSSAESVFSEETVATSITTLPALQTKGPDNSDAQMLEPVLEDDPRSFDLVAPPSDDKHVGVYLLERRAEQLFSSEHLHIIFSDPKLLLKFTGFLSSHRPQTIPILIYYLDALKAIRAIEYANAIAEALEPIKGYDFTKEVAQPTMNVMLEEKANLAFEVLVREDLPAFIAHIWTQVVSISIQRRITGTLAPHLREMSEGLAEVFCLTDPSRNDNPIVFASEEFTRTTQYGMGYIIGRNCRFLQGPRTNPNSVRRLAEACAAGKECSEVFVNYRRDGSPFMNLLMIAPLMDSRGNIRYFIGAQVDVSGLVKDCSELEGLAKMVEQEQDSDAGANYDAEATKKDEFQSLSEMLNGAELETVRRFGGRMHKEYVDDSDVESIAQGRPRLRLKDSSPEVQDRRRDNSIGMAGNSAKERLNGKLQGVYQHYLLVRPAPSLRILFTSPSLRVPGILQSPFLHRIGGSSRVRTDLAEALGEGRGVTAKIRWLAKADEHGEGEGRPRWIHCTPLLGHSGAVGVWMIVLVDEEGAANHIGQGRRFRPAPPVAETIGGKEWDSRAHHSRSRERRPINAYDKENERRGGGGGGGYRTDRGDSFPMPVSSSSGGSLRKGSHVARQSTQQQNHGGSILREDGSDFSFNIRTPSEDPRRAVGY